MVSSDNMSTWIVHYLGEIDKLINKKSLRDSIPQSNVDILPLPRG
jgi:hypothetical protein